MGDFVDPETLLVKRRKGEITNMNINFEVTEIIIHVLLPRRGGWVCVTHANVLLMYEIEN